MIWPSSWNDLGKKRQQKEKAKQNLKKRKDGKKLHSLNASKSNMHHGSFPFTTALHKYHCVF